MASVETGDLQGNGQETAEDKAEVPQVGSPVKTDRDVEPAADDRTPQEVWQEVDRGSRAKE